MPAAHREVTEALQALQRLVRRPPLHDSEPLSGMTRRLPLEMTNNVPTGLHLSPDKVDAMLTLERVLLDDLGFEHLEKVEDVVWNFVARAWTDKITDHVPAFLERHQKEPVEDISYIPIEFLSILPTSDSVEISGEVMLLQLTDMRIPPRLRQFGLDPPVGCVASVRVLGTSYPRMAQRAREKLAQSLRVLRIALREHRSIAHQQLRFRVGRTCAISDRYTSGEWPDDVAFELTLDDALVGLAREQPVSVLATRIANDIEQKAALATRWMEQAWLTGDPLIALLYLFFALEALLGDKSEKLKAHGLAFRQAMLSHLISGAFFHPDETWLLYDEVRSGAVHGEDTPAVNWDITHKFAWSVRTTLNEYLTLAKREGISRRGRLLVLLDNHPDQAKLQEWLRLRGGPMWASYLKDATGEA